MIHLAVFLAGAVACALVIFIVITICVIVGDSKTKELKSENQRLRFYIKAQKLLKDFEKVKAAVENNKPIPNNETEGKNETV